MLVGHLIEHHQANIAAIEGFCSAALLSFAFVLDVQVSSRLVGRLGNRGLQADPALRIENPGVAL